MAEKFWSGERIDKLKRLLAEGKSSLEIGDYFGVKPERVRKVIERKKLREATLEKAVGQPSKLEQARKKLSDNDIARRLMLLQNLEIAQAEAQQTFTDEQLLAWTNSYSLFIKELCSVELQEYQLQMIDLMRKRKRCCFVMGRQIGKTFTTALFSITHCIINANQKVVIVAPSLRQSKILFDACLGFIARSDPLFQSVSKTTSGLEFLIKFTNGSQILAVPCGDRGETIRGLRADILICEEAAFVPDEVFATVEPFLATTGGKLILISTPFGTQGKLWHSFNSGEYAKLRLPTSANKFVDKEWLEQAKNELSSLAYQTEVLAEFSENINNLFKLELRQKITQKYDLTNFPEEGKQYFMGIDWGRRHNSSLLIIGRYEENDAIKTTNIIEIQNEDFVSQVERIKKLQERYHFVRIVAEDTGLGIPACDMLESASMPVERFKATLQNKEDAFSYLLKQMEDGKVIIPDHPKLQFQLANFQFEITQAGHMKLHHLTEEIGDDFVDALCFMVWASKRTGLAFFTSSTRYAKEQKVSEVFSCA